MTFRLSISQALPGEGGCGEWGAAKGASWEVSACVQGDCTGNKWPWRRGPRVGREAGGRAHSPPGRVRRAAAQRARGTGARPAAVGTGPGARARAGRGPAPVGRAGTAGARPWGPVARKAGARPRSRCWAPRRLPPWGPAGPRPQAQPGRGKRPRPRPRHRPEVPPQRGRCPHPRPPPCWALRPHPGAAGDTGAAGARGSGGPPRLRGHGPLLHRLLERNPRCCEPQVPPSQVGLLLPPCCKSPPLQGESSIGAAHPHPPASRTRASPRGGRWNNLPKAQVWDKRAGGLLASLGQRVTRLSWNTGLAPAGCCWALVLRPRPCCWPTGPGEDLSRAAPEICSEKS